MLSRFGILRRLLIVNLNIGLLRLVLLNPRLMSLNSIALIKVGCLNNFFMHLSEILKRLEAHGWRILKTTINAQAHIVELIKRDGSMLSIVKRGAQERLIFVKE